MAARDAGWRAAVALERIGGLVFGVTRRRQIPVYPLTDYAPPTLAELGVIAGRFEASLAQRPNRARFHRHEHFELFLLEGAGTHFNDFREYPLRGATLVLVSPGQVHGWPEATGLRGTMVGFTAGFFDGREPPPSALLGHPLAYGGASPVVALSDPAAGELARLGAQMETEFSERAAEWGEALRALLRLALVQARRASTEHAAAETRPAELVRRFRLAVEEHFRTTTSVGALAARLKVTPGHLNATVRAQTGRAAGDWVRERVLLEAKRLLLHSELGVAEIAYHLGFDDPSYFARFFRRETAQAPGAFREAIRENYRSNHG